jgi:hypothetical protein
MKIGNIELNGWTNFDAGYCSRLSPNFSYGRSKDIACVSIFYDETEKYIGRSTVMNWTVEFRFQLDPLNEIFRNSYGRCISDTEYNIKKCVDNFLIRVGNLLVFA